MSAMSRVRTGGAVLGAALVVAGGLMAGSARAGDDCYGLWYDRNLIFAVNGYCFKTPEAREIFAIHRCWTDSPQLSRGEQREVDRILAAERAAGCR